MVSARLCSLAVAVALGAAAPASAQWWKMGALADGAGQSATAPAPVAKKPATSTAIPEPADFALFAAGVVGLLLGRRGSRSRRGDGE